MSNDFPDYPTNLTNQQVIKLKDLKARKGHLCLGGTWSDVEGPVCGCGVPLHTAPDFLGPDGRGVPPQGPAPDEVYAAQAADEPDDQPPWDEADSLVDADELSGDVDQRGRTLTTDMGAPSMSPSVPPVDPTQPYGPAEIERAILDQVRRLERGLAHEANLIAGADQLKIEYELAYARAVRESDGGAADTRKADAVIKCEAQYRAYMDACAARDAMKAVTHTLRSTLSGLQSVGRSVGVAYQTTPGRGR